MSARIEQLYGSATLQGAEILGLRKFGVPPGGAFDRESLAVANRLCGNEPNSLAIELANGSVELEFEVPTQVGVAGAAPGFGRSVEPGERLSVAIGARGYRAYIAVKGGWLPQGIDTRTARRGRVLVPGDLLKFVESGQRGKEVKLATLPESLETSSLRILPFGEHRFARSIAGPVVVSNTSDRTGIRFDGYSTEEFTEILSEPACVGALQLTSSGQLIAIGPDGPTIGGYPKVGVICNADRDKLAQLRPGQEVILEIIDLETARNLTLQRAKRLSSTLAGLQLRRSISG